ncbi:MAG: ATP-binding cassette domain-containing protein [Candidatus Omnitrophica bacterium]|nr:ATP-binding cassette domain-containing protein [Candidatus Omnitrophota bacterium]
MRSILEVSDITKHFYKKKGLFDAHPDVVKAVDGVSFSVERGKTFGLVGASGCGKTTLAKVIAGMIRPDSGDVSLHGEFDMVFQDPYSSLNPRMTAQEIVGEGLLVRGGLKAKVKVEVERVLGMVRLDPDTSMMKYPHQFSGGERQRIAIARALIRRPDIIILDEPVSSLDVSIQAGILNLLKDLKEELGVSYLFISHDLRVVEFMSDTVGVMKDGRFVETAPAEDIYRSPKDGYTRELLEAIPAF